MNESPRYVTVRDYLRVVRERRVLIVALTILFGVNAYALAKSQTPVYEAEAAIQFESPNTQPSLLGTAVDPGGVTPEQRAAANAATLTRPAVLDRARRALGRDAPEDLESRVSAQPEARTQLVIVQGTGTSARQAARVTNAVARAAVAVTTRDVRREFRSAARAQRRVLDHLPSGPESQFFRIQQLNAAARLEELARVAKPATIRRSATPPAQATSPRIVRTSLLGVLVGLTLGLVAAFVRDSLDRRFRSAREIAGDLDVPLLGSVPERLLGRVPLERKGTKRLAPRELESFRIIRNNIEFLSTDEPPKVVLVTSALPEEGKSTVSIALATTFAIAGKRTLLVECDLRRPTLARRLALDATPGLSDYLSGNSTPTDILQTIDLPRDSVNGVGPQGTAFAAIVAGTPASQALEVLRSKRCSDFFDQVTQVYDAVVIDSSPLLSVADTLELLPVADAVVLCVRASRTTRDQLHAAKSTLEHFTDQPSAIVVTGLRNPDDEDTPYGYYGHEAAAR